MQQKPLPEFLIEQALFIANGRCNMCGKSTVLDEVQLVIELRIPQEWGGEPTDDNVWAICELCSSRRRNFIKTLPLDKMKKCMRHTETIKRIGELLKAFEGEMVPRILLEIVGQDDEWTRRLRELRTLGWKVERVIDTAQKGRYQHAYRLVQFKPWPQHLSAALKNGGRDLSSL